MSFSDHQNSVKWLTQSPGNGISESLDSKIFHVSPGSPENSCIYGAQLVPLALLPGGGFENFEPGASSITLRHWPGNYCFGTFVPKIFCSNYSVIDGGS